MYKLYILVNVWEKFNIIVYVYREENKCTFNKINALV